MSTIPPLARQLGIFYGSQTGTSIEVAEQISRMASIRGMEPVLHSLNDAIEILPTFSDVIFVASTTGDGEVPDNMKKMWHFLLNRGLPNDCLSGIDFAIFGLGDSSYSNFNVVARRLGTRLLQLGAKEAITRGLGDDQHKLGLFGELYPWLDRLWKFLLDKYPLPPGYVPDDSPKMQQPRYTIKEISMGTNGSTTVNKNSFYDPPCDVRHQDNGNPYPARLVSNKRITAKDWEQDVRHIELDIGSELWYNPGDIVYIYPENTGNINSFIEYLGFHPSTILSLTPRDGFQLDIPSPCTIKDLMTKYLDILGTPRRYFFERLSLFATNEEEKEKLLELSTSEGADLLHDYCTREKRSYVEVFQDFQSCKPSLEHLLDLIPRLRPRAFSISSSMNLFKSQLHITMAVVEFKTPYGRLKKGVCSTWLASLDSIKMGEKGETIPIWIKKGILSLPEDSSRPIIMIGPGTGLAPMRSMIQHRRHLLLHPTTKTENFGSIHLFFGCRHEHKDFLYSNELLEYHQDGVISLNTAFSRDQSHKIYVQTRIIENKELIANLLLNERAYCFVSGSAKGMASDVHSAIRDVLRSVAKLSLADANLFMKRLERSKRYVTEAWA